MQDFHEILYVQKVFKKGLPKEHEFCKNPLSSHSNNIIVSFSYLLVDLGEIRYMQFHIIRMSLC
jgi:hypothetical protein